MARKAADEGLRNKDHGDAKKTRRAEGLTAEYPIRWKRPVVEMILPLKGKVESERIH